MAHLKTDKIETGRKKKSALALSHYSFGRHGRRTVKVNIRRSLWFPRC